MKQQRAYVRSGDTACPLHWALGTIDAAGNFIADGDIVDGMVEQTKYPLGKYFLDAGFLVVYIDAVDDENDVLTDSTSKLLAETVHGCVRGMFSGCLNPALQIRYERLATFAEFNHKIRKYGKHISHVIIVGHGNTSGVKFLDLPENASGDVLSEAFEDTQRSGIQVMLLSCSSACESISASLSRSAGVSSVISPTEGLAMAWTIQFVAGYFANYFLKSKSMIEAVNTSIIDKDSVPMCVWENGSKTYCSSNKRICHYKGYISPIAGQHVSDRPTRDGQSVSAKNEWHWL